MQRKLSMEGGQVMSKNSRDFQRGYIIGSNLDKQPKSHNSSAFGYTFLIILAFFIIAGIVAK